MLDSYLQIHSRIQIYSLFDRILWIAHFTVKQIQFAYQPIDQSNGHVDDWQPKGANEQSEKHVKGGAYSENNSYRKQFV